MYTLEENLFNAHRWHRHGRYPNWPGRFQFSILSTDVIIDKMIAIVKERIKGTLRPLLNDTFVLDLRDQLRDKTQVAVWIKAGKPAPARSSSSELHSLSSEQPSAWTL